MAATSLAGSYHHPDVESMAEREVTTPGRGAVASFSATGATVSSGDHVIAKGFHQSLADGEQRLGEATFAAKRLIFESHSQFRNQLDLYLLFGDPALKVQIASTDLTLQAEMQPTAGLEPGDSARFVLQYSNAGNTAAADVTITNILPDAFSDVQISSDPPLPYTTQPLSGQQSALRSAGAHTPAAVNGVAYQWTIDELAPGASGVITLTATLDPSVTPGTQLSNEASISGAGVESNPADNQSSLPVTVQGDALVVMGGVAWQDEDSDGVLHPLKPIVWLACTSQPPT